MNITAARKPGPGRKPLVHIASTSRTPKMEDGNRHMIAQCGNIGTRDYWLQKTEAAPDCKACIEITRGKRDERIEKLAGKSAVEIVKFEIPAARRGRPISPNKVAPAIWAAALAATNGDESRIRIVSATRVVVS